MNLTSQPLNKLLEAFRSSAPTPGGGSAAALGGAVGASLLAMVAGLPKPRAASAPEVERLAAAGGRCTELAQQLEALVDRDSEAYDLLVGAYRMPKATEEEKSARTTRIQTALKAAIEAPLEVMRACGAGIAQGATIVELGNQNASSDVQAGLELLHAGLRAARLNVDINLGSLKDAEYAARVTQEADGLSSRALKAFAAGRAQLADE